MREHRIPALAIPVIEGIAALTVLSVGLLAAGPTATAFALVPNASPAAATSTPTDSGTPTAAPTGGSTPSPTSSGPSPTPSASPQGSPTPAPSTTPTPSPTPTALPTAPNTRSPINITSSALQVSGFTYAGTKTLTTQSGPVPVMEFAMGDATFTDLVVRMPCSGHSQLRMAQSEAHATGNLTLDLTWFTASVAGTVVAYTPSAPPSSPPLSSGAGTFNAPSMIALGGLGSQLMLQSTSITAVSC